jgi:hypothetical protein
MARPVRVEFPGALYHVIVRGSERKAVFRDDRDRPWLRPYQPAAAVRKNPISEGGFKIMRMIG